MAKGTLRGILLYGSAGALAAFGVASYYSSLSSTQAEASMKERASALALSAAAMLDGSQHAMIEDEHFLAYETQWKALRQLAFSQDSAGGLKGTEILTLRMDDKGGFVSVFAPEGQRFKKLAKSLL